MNDTLQQLYDSSVIIDGTSPLLMQHPDEWKRYADGGVDAVLTTVTLDARSADTFERLADWTAFVEKQKDFLLIARSVEDIRRAKAEGKLALVLQFQNTPVDRNVNLIGAYAQLGLRVNQLTYNYRNAVGDGCLEPENAGLSEFGKNVVKALNDNRVLVDLSHTGERTTLDALETSERPDAFTHANAKGVFDHPRNLTDEQIKRVAEKNGVIGVCSSCVFLKPIERPSVEDIVDHLDYFVQLVGIDHIGFSTDAYDYTKGYYENIAAGIWNPADYPAPPIFDPVGPTNMFDMAESLGNRGYTHADIAKVMGGNFLRLFEEVWGG